MMTKVLVYGYCVGVFSSRRIERRLAEDVGFRVLAAGNAPNDSRELELRQSIVRMLFITTGYSAPEAIEAAERAAALAEKSGNLRQLGAQADAQHRGESTRRTHHRPLRGRMVYVYLYCSNQEMWDIFFKTISRPEVADDPRFTDRKQRRENIELLTQIVEEWTSQRTKQEVMKIIGEAGVPCGAVLDSVELLEDPHLRERGMIVTVDHPVRGKFTMPGCPVQLEDSPVEVMSAPLLGQHNSEVYGGVLGFTDGELQQLKRDSVI